jgi:hypothetical protein
MGAVYVSIVMGTSTVVVDVVISSVVTRTVVATVAVGVGAC